MIKYTLKGSVFFMASKGQKFRKYDKDIIHNIVKEHNETYKTPRELSEKYNIPYATISNWIYKYNNPEKYPGLELKRGKPKEKDLTKEDWKERYEILKKYQAFLKAQRGRK